MYQVSIERHFDAAHYLRDYQGKCENLHGHRYVVVAKVKASELNKIGLAFDFTILKKDLDKILSLFDHTCLNDVPPFDTINPSAENIAEAVYRELKLRLDKEKEQAYLTQVQVWESPDSSATYIPDV